MVAHPRTPARPHRLRPLREPKPIDVEADGEWRPVAVTLGGRRLRVVAVQDAWRIDDEWWRERPVSRMYWQVELEDGQALTLYDDLLARVWFRQAYR